MYICDRCNKEFKRNANLKYHKQNNVCNKKYHICKYCNKKYATKNNMYRHMKHNCSVKKMQENYKTEIYNRLIELEKENKQLKSDIQDIQTINTENNTINYNIKDSNISINNGTINNITLVSHGKEDISKIDNKELLKAIKTAFNST
jgi:ribosomal protein S10